MLSAHASLAPDWLRSGHGPQPLGCRAVLPLPAHVLLASDWLIMHVAHIKHAEMCPEAHLCVTHRASEQAPSKPSKLSKFRPSTRLGSVACMLGSACSVAHSGRSGSAQFGRAADWAAWARFAPPSRAARPSMLGLITALMVVLITRYHSLPLQSFKVAYECSCN